MATLRTAILLSDGMSPVLRKAQQGIAAISAEFDAMAAAGNEAINLNKLDAAQSALQDLSGAVDELADGFSAAEQAQERMTNSLSKSLEKNQKTMENAVSGANKLVGGLNGITAAKKSVGWLQESMGLADIQNGAERQLKVILANAGQTQDAFDQLKQTASDIQGATMYGDEGLIAGAAEMGTYASDPKAIQSMMGTLANYAAGMSGGKPVNDRQMVEYATQLGKVLNGSFDGIREKGFALTDAQKAIIENGSDMEKALVVDDIISQSWGSLAEQMAKTPMGAITQFQNAWGDLKEEIGNRMYPVIMRLFQALTEHMPQIERFLNAFVTIAGYAIEALIWLIGLAGDAANWLIDHWEQVAPVLMTVVGAFLIMKAVMAAISIGQALASMFASPLGIIILVIAAIYAVVAGINEATGASISATGVICGALAFAGAAVYNIFMGLIEIVLALFNSWVNKFTRVANFIANVFKNPVSSIIYLFQGMADSVLGIIEGIAKAIDWVFGTKLAAGVSNWRGNLKGMADDLVQKLAPNEDYKEVVKPVNLSLDPLELNRIEYNKAWDAGYKLGEDIDNAVKGLFDGSAFPPYEDQFDWDSVPPWSGALDDIANDTGNISKGLGETVEDLKYLRDIAEQEAINRFTTAEIKLEMTNNNTVNSEMDLDGIADHMGEKLLEVMEVAAEGVHS